MQKHRVTAPQRPLFFLLTLAVLSLSACDVFDDLAEVEKSMTPQIQGPKENFKPIAEGYSLSVISSGFKGQEVFFLTPDEGTVRWNRKEDSFERFGGDLPQLSSAGPLYADTQGGYHFYDRLSSLYVLKSGSTQWQEQPLRALLPLSEERQGNGYLSWAVGQSGDEVVIVEERATSIRHFLKRQQATGDFKPWFELDPREKPFHFSSDNLHLQPNGDLLMTDADEPWIIPAGTKEPKPLFDCSVILTKHCAARVFLRGNAHNKMYAVGGASGGKIQIYKIPENSSFPVVPEALPLLEHGGKQNGTVFLDEQGELWAILVAKDAETIPGPPFFRDVATLLQLQGGRWVSKKNFYPPDNCCTMGFDRALYTFGFQLAAGGVYVGQPVYRLTL